MYHYAYNNGLEFTLPISVIDDDGDKIKSVAFSKYGSSTNYSSNFSHENGQITFTTKTSSNNCVSQSFSGKNKTYSFKTGIKVNVTINTESEETNTVTLTVSFNSGSESNVDSWSVIGEDIVYGNTLDQAITLTTPSQTGNLVIIEDSITRNESSILPAGSHTLKYTYNPTGCYKPSTQSITFNVAPLPVTLTSGSDSKTYDGEPLEKKEVTASVALVGDDEFIYSNFASQTEVGETDIPSPFLQQVPLI